MRPEWFPDWKYDIAAIIASGPSAKGINLDGLQRCKVIAIKRSFDLYPAADVVYGCDAPWWREVRGLPKFKGLKICYRKSLLSGTEFPDIKRVEIIENCDKLLFDEPGTIGSGGNSGFQSLNLALQFGAKRVVLIGFDMTDRPGAHWYGRNNWPGANNPSPDNFKRWIKTMETAAIDLAARGIEVINTSPYGALKAFTRWSLDDTLKAWA